MPLTALQAKNAKPGRHSDGSGLYLLVSPSGSKSWMLRVQVEGKRRDIGLGSFKDVTLVEAREKALTARKLAKAGKDPSAKAQVVIATTPTFEVAARRLHEQAKRAWRNGKHTDQWLNTLEAYVFPSLGERLPDEIAANDIYQVLSPIWLTKPETARRVRQRVLAVLDNAQAMGWRQTDAPARGLNTLLKGLKQPAKGHFAAMPYVDVPAFYERLSAGPKTAGRLALRFLVLTAARSGEVRGAMWREVDFEIGHWIIPADRMKMGVAHVVPLSRPALHVLAEARTLFSSKPESLIFPGQARGQLSDMTLTKALRANGGQCFTVHGFRSSFRDWAAEGGYPNDWAEAALAHAVRNKVEAAYRRTTFLEQRRGLMKDWGDFCISLAD